MGKMSSTVLACKLGSQSRVCNLATYSRPGIFNKNIFFK